MNLSELRPQKCASAEEVQLLIKKDWRAALPEELSDHLLLALALNARTVQSAERLRSRERALAPILHAVLGLVAGDLARAAPLQEFRVTERELVHAVQTYADALDTEICTRILGLPSPHTHGLLARLRAQAPGLRNPRIHHP